MNNYFQNFVQFNDKLNFLGLLFNFLKILLLSFFISFAVFPYLGNLTKSIKIFEITDLQLLFGSSALILLILITSWKWSNNFWRRYRNTYKITSNIFTFIDFTFSVIIFSLSTSLLAPVAVVPLSLELILFLLINLFFLAIYFVSSYMWVIYAKPLTPSPRKSTDDTSDDPIKYFDEDLLNRGTFVKGLFDEIKELNLAESFVFGLYGKWGEGKSSVLNLLRIMLERDNTFIVMNFEPWNFKDEEAILKAFFNTMEKSISKDYIFPNLRKALFKYQKLISSGLSRIGFAIDFGLEDETIDEVKEKIEKYISNTGKKLLIIIDEIDRLEPEEVRMIFKLVRSNSKFKNTVFLLSLDKGKTTKQITDGDEFLEKIVQKPIILPKVEQSFIDKFILFSEHKIPEYTISELQKLPSGSLVSTFGYVTKYQKEGIFISEEVEEEAKGQVFVRFKNNLKAKFKLGDKVFVEGIYRDNEITLDDPNARLVSFKLSRIDVLLERMFREGKITLKQIAYFDKEFSYLYRSQVSKLIENFRDAKIFLNSLSSSYPAIADEVDPFDYICLELIKVFAKDLYDDIYDHWWFYVGQRQDGDILNSPFSMLLSSEKDKKRVETGKHLDELITNSEKLEYSHKIAIRAILSHIFPQMGEDSSVSEEARTTKRIQSTAFLKYFTLSVPSTELSDTFFEKEIKRWGENPTEEVIYGSFLKLQEQGKLVEFLDKIRSVYLEVVPENVLKVMLKTISKNIKTFSKKEYGDIWDSEYDKALMLVLRTLNLRIKNEEIQSELEEMIETTDDNLFAVDLVLTTKRERGGDLYRIYEHIDPSKNRNLVVAKLEKYYVNEKHNVFTEGSNGNMWIRILYQWSSNWSDENTQNKQNVAKYIISIFKDNPKGFIQFLKSLNGSITGNEWNMNYGEYSKVYDLDALKTLAKYFLNENAVDKESEKILSKFVSIVEENSTNKE